MPLHRLKDYYPNYKETLADGQMHSIDSYSLYTQGGEKIGSAKDILVDDSGRFRYLVVDTGPWIFGKSVLLPIGLANFDYQNDRIHVNGLTKDQVENLPEYKDDMVIDEHHEGQVRSGYQPLGQQRSGRQFMGQTYAAGQPIRQVEDMRGLEGTAGMAPVEGAVRTQR
ncbi:MAG TPA: PRC-barrel domain-containing protein, partial [Trichocoleus sp.]